MKRAYLGLGSNLGDRLRNLESAVTGLAGSAGVTVVAVSGVYRTEPVGRPGQPEYLNAAVSIDTGLSPRELLGLVNRIEDANGRERQERWGPRTLDIDILLYGAEKVNEVDLRIPHPRLSERRFALLPLARAGPDAALPDGTAISLLLERLEDGPGAVLDPGLVIRW